jgi:hypothetical protein
MIRIQWDQEPCLYSELLIAINGNETRLRERFLQEKFL